MSRLKLPPLHLSTSDCASVLDLVWSSMLISPLGLLWSLLSLTIKQADWLWNPLKSEVQLKTLPIGGGQNE